MKKMTKKLRPGGQGGFTLIEALVAMAVLSIGILAMMAMQTISAKGNSTANMITNAAMNGANQLEDIFAMYFDDPRLDDIDNDLEGGLYDMQCCDGGVDAMGKAVAGCTQVADYCAVGQDDYEIYVNVAPGFPMQGGTKRVVVQVLRNRNGVRDSIPYEYIVGRDLQGLTPTAE